MSENSGSAYGSDPDGGAGISAREAADFIFKMTTEMAAMSEAQGLVRVAAALALARMLCADELSRLR